MVVVASVSEFEDLLDIVYILHFLYATQRFALDFTLYFNLLKLRLKLKYMGIIIMNDDNKLKFEGVIFFCFMKGFFPNKFELED